MYQTFGSVVTWAPSMRPVYPLLRRGSARKQWHGIAATPSVPCGSTGGPARRHNGTGWRLACRAYETREPPKRQGFPGRGARQVARRSP